jgi:hypothetical protein
MLIYNCLNGQNNFENLNLTIRASAITGCHIDKPIKFPIGYTEASITPIQQQYRLGYDISTEISKFINNRFSSGIILYLTQFSFEESGSELSFWTNEISNYSLSRDFTMLGIGVNTGFRLINKELSSLNFSTGLTYEIMLSNKNIFLWRESENNSKYSFNCAIEYTHKVSKHSNLLIGLMSKFGLKDYFSSIKYKPTRYGVSIGMQMTIIEQRVKKARS